MKNYGRIKSQKYIDTFTWNKIVFNKYLIKFEGNDEFYVINRNEELEQALIGGNILYASDSDNQIKNYKILSFERPKDFFMMTKDQLREMLVEYKLMLDEKN